MKIFLFSKYGKQGASSRMRTLQFLPFFSEQIDIEVNSLISDDALNSKYSNKKYSLSTSIQLYLARFLWLLKITKADRLWLEKELFPWAPAWLELIFLARRPYMIDFDDAIFHKYDKHRLGMVRCFLGRKIDRLMAKSALVVAGNQYLGQRALDAGAKRVEIIPTVVHLARYAAKDWSEQPVEPMIIVWIGSPSTTKYLQLLERPLAQLSQKYSLCVRLIGAAPITLQGCQVEQLPWTADTEAELVRSGDIGVMPLEDGFWERGKCGYKLIQYMACGLPVVATAISANFEIVDQGINGFLVKTEQEWFDRLDRLLSDRLLRQHLGTAGRKKVEQQYCIEVTAPKLEALFDDMSS